MVEAEPEAVAEPAHGAEQDQHHRREADGRADSEQVDADRTVFGGEQGVAEQGAYHHQVDQDRREVRQEKAPVRIQDAGHDSVDAVKEDLGNENPEQQDRYLQRLAGFLGRKLLGGGPVGREPDYRPGEDNAGGGYHRQERQHEGEQRVREVPGVLVAVGGHPLYEKRDKNRVEDTAEEKLVDNNGQDACGSVGVGHDADPEDRGHGYRPGVARNPREGGHGGYGNDGPDDS